MATGSTWNKSGFSSPYSGPKWAVDQASGQGWGPSQGQGMGNANNQYEWNKQGFSRPKSGGGNKAQQNGSGSGGGKVKVITGGIPKLPNQTGGTANVKTTPRDKVMWTQNDIRDQVASAVGSQSQMLTTGANSPLAKKNTTPGITYGQRNMQSEAFQLAPILAGIATDKYGIPQQRAGENLLFRSQQELAQGKEGQQLYDAWRRGQHSQNQYTIGSAQPILNALQQLG